MIWLAELMPLCFVRWYAKRHMQRLPCGRYTVVKPRKDVMIVVQPQRHGGSQ